MAQATSYHTDVVLWLDGEAYPPSVSPEAGHATLALATASWSFDYLKEPVASQGRLTSTTRRHPAGKVQIKPPAHKLYPFLLVLFPYESYDGPQVK